MADIDTQAELDLLGEGPAATDGDHLDEHALLDQTPPPGDDHNGVSHVKSEELKNEDVDLYDDAIAPSSGRSPSHQRLHAAHFIMGLRLRIIRMESGIAVTSETWFGGQPTLISRSMLKPLESQT